MAHAFEQMRNKVAVAVMGAAASLYAAGQESKGQEKPTKTEGNGTAQSVEKPAQPSKDILAQPSATLGTRSTTISDPPKEIHVRSPNGVIIESRYRLGEFKHNGMLVYVYVNDALRRKYAGDIPKGADLSTFKFYLSPCVNFQTDKVEKSIQAALKNGPVDSMDGSNLYRMNLVTDLNPKELCAKAAIELGAQYSTAVPVKNISLLPFNYVRLTRLSDDYRSTTELGSWPPKAISESLNAQLSGYEIAPSFPIVGTEKQLRNLIKPGQIWVDFSIDGSIVKTNSVEIALNIIVKLGYLEVLKGDATNERLYELEKKISSGGFNLGGIISNADTESRLREFSAQRSYVSRNQLRNVLQSVQRVMIQNKWIEFEEDLGSFESDVLALLGKHIETFEVTITAQGEALLANDVKQSLAPDVVTKIENKAKDIAKLDGTGDVGYQGLSIKSTGKQETEQDSSSAREGKEIVPKVLVCVFNNHTLLEDFTRFSRSTQRAESSRVRFMQPSAVGKYVTTPAVIDRAYPIIVKVAIAKVPAARDNSGDLDICSRSPFNPFGMNFQFHSITVKDGKIIIPYTFRVEEQTPDHTKLAYSDVLTLTPDKGRVVGVATYAPSYPDSAAAYEWRSGLIFDQKVYSAPVNVGILKGSSDQSLSFTFHAKGDGPGDDADNPNNAYFYADGVIRAAVELKPAKTSWVDARDLAAGANAAATPNSIAVGSAVIDTHALSTTSLILGQFGVSARLDAQLPREIPAVNTWRRPPH